MKRFAGYELLEQLQPGNHGTFHTARPPSHLAADHDIVALKILDRHATDNEFKRMAAELRVLVELGHPRLVEVVDAGHEDGRLYYATRYYREGGLAPGPTDDVAGVAGLVADAAEAAHALHEIGVAHRDIKPSNILCSAGRGFLSDLGVANYANAQFTTTGSSPVGTLSYADPRLIHGDPPGRSSDIWSLGATLHAAVTGHSVIGAIPTTHLAAAIEYVLGADIRVHPSCPAPVAAVVARATQADRADRYGTAAELAAELRAVVGLVVEPSRPRGDGGDDATPLARGDRLVASAAVPAHRQPVFVIGARSPGGHLNHPGADRCRVSGEVRPPGVSWLAERGPRPPLGVLVFDDGRSYVVRCDTVIGRQPEIHERVVDGTAAPLGLAGESTMSRAHAVIELRDWQVHLRNLSANGTTIESVQAGPRTLRAGESAQLHHDDVVVIRGRRLSYHSHHC